MLYEIFVYRVFQQLNCCTKEKIHDEFYFPPDMNRDNQRMNMVDPGQSFGYRVS